MSSPLAGGLKLTPLAVKVLRGRGAVLLAFPLMETVRTIQLVQVGPDLAHASTALNTLLKFVDAERVRLA